MKLQLLKELLEQQKKSSEWLAQLPSDIQVNYYDNGFVEPLIQGYELLLETIFSGEELLPVMWFLYEWSTDISKNVYIKDTQYTINLAEDFYSTMVKEFGWV